MSDDWRAAISARICGVCHTVQPKGSVLRIGEPPIWICDGCNADLVKS